MEMTQIEGPQKFDEFRKSDKSNEIQFDKPVDIII